MTDIPVPSSSAPTAAVDELFRIELLIAKRADAISLLVGTNRGDDAAHWHQAEGEIFTSIRQSRSQFD